MRFLLALCITLCSFTNALARPAAQTSRDAKELRRLEKVWNDAQLSGDATALDRLWGDDLVVTVPDMPLMDKRESLELVRSGKLKFRIYNTSDLRIRIYRDTAVVTGQLERTRSDNRGAFEDDWRFTKVYVRRSGRWQVVAWHGSHVGT